ncbi:MAG: hypothetical protein K9N35_08595 [Candidatus Marinimicrobia bacterium]|nr:hypothetical protein [Candidatus Neomarinimicrobiota bacterium]
MQSDDRFADFLRNQFGEPADGLKWTRKKDQYLIQTNDGCEPLPLSSTQIDRLDDSRIIKKMTGYRHYDHCGFAYKQYAEFFIGINNMACPPFGGPEVKLV